MSRMNTKVYHKICPVCGGRATGPHHITPRSEGGTDDERNIVYLCSRCHDIIEEIYDKTGMKYCPKLIKMVRVSQGFTGISPTTQRICNITSNTASIIDPYITLLHQGKLKHKYSHSLKYIYNHQSKTLKPSAVMNKERREGCKRLLREYREHREERREGCKRLLREYREERRDRLQRELIVRKKMKIKDEAFILSEKGFFDSLRQRLQVSCNVYPS